VVAAPDFNNNNLAANGVITTFISAKQDVSPWNSANPLWESGGVTADQAACDAVATGNAGQVTLCYTPDEDQSLRYVFISITDNSGTTMFQKVVSAD
jgi:hypothetical protein